MNYKVEQIVKNVLIVDSLEFLVNDTVKIYMIGGDIFSCLIAEIYDDCIRICNQTFGYCTISYSDIKNILLVEK